MQKGDIVAHGRINRAILSALQIVDGQTRQVQFPVLFFFGFIRNHGGPIENSPHIDDLRERFRTFFKRNGRIDGRRNDAAQNARPEDEEEILVVLDFKKHFVTA